MSLRRHMITGGMLIGLTQVAIMALSFGRNVIIARVVSVADMGIAATIGLALMIIEAASDMSVNQLIVQAKDGDDQELQASAHTFMALRGLITAMILGVAGGPLARLFHVPQAAWAFQLMAIAPLIRGFAHQDLWRYHRHMHFAPLAGAELISQTVALIAAWPLAIWARDYSVMLWVILIQVTVMTIISHVMNERTYRLGANKVYMRRIIGFGWPLLFNGILILILNYGDRAIIAAFPAFSMADVGLYMVASTVVLMPTMLVQKIAGTILLPALAKAQDDRGRFISQFKMITGGVGLIAILQTILLTIAGPSLVVLFFGDKYGPVASFFGWLAAACGVRVLRLSPTIASLAGGDTRNTLIANIARISGFGIALVAAALDGGLIWFAFAAFLGELVSFVVSFVAFAYQSSIIESTSLFIMVFLLIAIALSMGLFEAVRGPDVMWIIPFAVALLAGVIATLFATWIFVPVREEMQRFFRGLRELRSRLRAE